MSFIFPVSFNLAAVKSIHEYKISEQERVHACGHCE